MRLRQRPCYPLTQQSLIVKDFRLDMFGEMCWILDDVMRDANTGAHSRVLCPRYSFGRNYTRDPAGNSEDQHETETS